MAGILVYIGISFLLAFFIETMVEYVFGTPIDNIPALKKLGDFKWLLRYIAAGVGIYFSFYWKIDLVAVVARLIGDAAGSQQAWDVSAVGMIISGLTMGRGSNYLHEFLSKHFKKPSLKDL